MRRAAALLAPARKRWGGLKYKQDLRHVEERRSAAAKQAPGKEARQPPAKAARTATTAEPAPPPPPPSAAPTAQPDEEQKRQRQALLRELRDRRRQRAEEEFQQSVVSLLQHRTPPLYPDSFRFFEDVYADVVTPSLGPSAQGPSPPPGYVAYLEQQLLERTGLTFRRKALMVGMESAFTHPSFITAEGDPLQAQRVSLLPLTYMGHALLHLHVRSYLVQIWPNRSLREYQLFADHWLTSATVCSLAESLRLPPLALTDAEHAGADSFLALRGTAGYLLHKPGVRIGCEVFEALVGAVYLDSDVLKATDFLQRVAIPYFTKNTPKSVFAAVRDCWTASSVSARPEAPSSSDTMNVPKSSHSPPSPGT